MDASFTSDFDKELAAFLNTVAFASCVVCVNHSENAPEEANTNKFVSFLSTVSVIE